MKIVRTLSDALWCSHVTDVAFASVWQIRSLLLPPWRVCTPFAADYLEAWYVMQLNLQILAHTHWTLGWNLILGNSLWLMWLRLSSVWFLPDEDLFFVPLSFCSWFTKWQVSVIMLAWPFFLRGFITGEQKYVCRLVSTPINSKLLCIRRLLLLPAPYFYDKSCDILFFLKTSGLVFHQKLCFH